MPCWQVQTVSVEFKAAHKDLLTKAIVALGWTSRELSSTLVLVRTDRYEDITLDLAKGKADLEPRLQPRLNELKRAYSLQAIKLATKLGGWQNRQINQSNGVLSRGFFGRP